MASLAQLFTWHFYLKQLTSALSIVLNCLMCYTRLFFLTGRSRCSRNRVFSLRWKMCGFCCSDVSRELAPIDGVSHYGCLRGYSVLTLKILLTLFSWMSTTEVAKWKLAQTIESHTMATFIRQVGRYRNLPLRLVRLRARLYTLC